jgi:hypothetical protein
MMGSLGIMTLLYGLQNNSWTWITWPPPCGVVVDEVMEVVVDDGVEVVMLDVVPPPLVVVVPPPIVVLPIELLGMTGDDGDWVGTVWGCVNIGVVELMLVTAWVTTGVVEVMVIKGVGNGVGEVSALLDMMVCWLLMMFLGVGVSRLLTDVLLLRVGVGRMDTVVVVVVVVSWMFPGVVRLDEVSVAGEQLAAFLGRSSSDALWPKPGLALSLS